MNHPKTNIFSEITQADTLYLAKKNAAGETEIICEVIKTDGVSCDLSSGRIDFKLAAFEKDFYPQGVIAMPQRVTHFLAPLPERRKIAMSKLRIGMPAVISQGDITLAVTLHSLNLGGNISAAVNFEAPLTAFDKNL